MIEGILGTKFWIHKDRINIIFSEFAPYKWTVYCKCDPYLITVLGVFSFTMLKLKPSLTDELQVQQEIGSQKTKGREIEADA